MRAAFLALAACVPEPKYQAPPNYGDENESAGMRAKEADVSLEPVHREHVVDAVAVIDGVEITAVPAGLTGWEVNVSNATAASLTVAWDESTFVTGTKKAAGRLVRGTTRRIDTAKTQPPTPVPAGSTLTEMVFPELLVRYEEQDEKLVDGRWPPHDLERGRRQREGVSKIIVGGQLTIAINTSSGKQTWTGAVRAAEGK